MEKGGGGVMESGRRWGDGEGRRWVMERKEVV